MLTSKFLASAVATIATAGAIGVAIARTSTQSGAGSTMSAEATPRADRN